MERVGAAEWEWEDECLTLFKEELTASLTCWINVMKTENDNSAKN